MESRKRIGAPTTYTQEIGEKICEFTRLYGSRLGSAWCVGLDPGTVSTWEDTKPHFAQMIKKARAEFLAERMKVVLSKDKDEFARWLPNMTSLERIFHDEYGRRMVTTGTLNQNVKVDGTPYSALAAKARRVSDPRRLSGYDKRAEEHEAALNGVENGASLT